MEAPEGSLGALLASSPALALANQPLFSQLAAPLRRQVTQQCPVSTARPSTMTSSGSRCGSSLVPGLLRTCPMVSLLSVTIPHLSLSKDILLLCYVTLGTLLNLSGPHLLWHL